MSKAERRKRLFATYKSETFHEGICEDVEMAARSIAFQAKCEIIGNESTCMSPPNWINNTCNCGRLRGPSLPHGGLLSTP